MLGAAVVVVALLASALGSNATGTVDDCAGRDPFTADFQDHWHAAYGTPHFGANVEDRVTGCTYGFGGGAAIFPLASSSKVLLMASAFVGVQDGAIEMDDICPDLTGLNRSKQHWLVGSIVGVRRVPLLVSSSRASCVVGR